VRKINFLVGRNGGVGGWWVNPSNTAPLHPASPIFVLPSEKPRAPILGINRDTVSIRSKEVVPCGQDTAVLTPKRIYSTERQDALDEA
jgi:hypothetical protein